MKKLSLIIAACLICVSLAGCSGNSSSEGGEQDSSAAENVSDKTPAEKTAELLETVEFPEMVEVTSEKLSIYYKIDADSVTEFSAYLCGSGAMPDEFGAFVAADDDAAAAVKSALEERIEKQRSTYADYTPGEMYKFDDCFVNQNGTTVYYAICASNSDALDILA